MGKNRLKAIIFALVLCNLYGAGIECIQGLFLPSRTFDIYDLMANGIGTLMGVTGSLFILNRIKSQRMGSATF